MATRETAMAALTTVLANSTGATVWRQTDLSRPIPPEGMITVMEGASTEQALLSTLAWDVTQHAEIVFTVTAADEPTRDAAMDLMLVRFGNAVLADRTLGGAVLWTEPTQPTFDAAETDGAAKSARVTVDLTYVTGGTVLN